MGGPEIPQVGELTSHTSRPEWSLVHKSPDILVRFDRDFRHTFVSDSIEELTGLPSENFVGKTHREAGIPEALCVEWQSSLDRVLTTGEPESVEFEFPDQGGVRVFKSLLKPDLDRNGRTRGVLCYTHDITEFRKAEAALVEAERRKDALLAMFAHEMRGPLTPLRHGIQVLKRAHDATMAAKILDALARQVDVLNRLVEDLLDVSRLRTDKIELRREMVVLQAAIHCAVDDCKQLYEDRRHRTQLRVPEAPVVLRADATRLQQVFYNLLTNAGKYTPPGGTIEVEVSVSPEHVAIAVCDTGNGIPADALDSVFGLFVQVEATRNEAGGGLGLGLAVVKKIVEMHGGSVAATSEGEGKGSTFTVVLPVA